MTSAGVAVGEEHPPRRSGVTGIVATMNPRVTRVQTLSNVLTVLMTLSGILGTLPLLNSFEDPRLGAPTVALATVFAACVTGRCLLELAPRP